jgi:hypothetical protein
MKRKPALALLLLLAVPAFSQTATELERIIAAPAVSCQDAAWLALIAAEAVSPETSADQAFRTAKENRWLSPRTLADQAITLGELSFLLMKSFHMRGGLFYTLFPGPRYGFRELTRLSLIPGRAYSSLRPTGARLLQILGGVLAHTGDVAALTAEADFRRLREEVTASLRDSARNQQGISAPSEGIMEYDNAFVPE